MTVDPIKVGGQILSLRKIKGITQNELGERLGVSFQAVSKWERGETLPDTAILSDLADVLETTVDNILRGGESIMSFKRKITIDQMREGIECFEKMGELLGKDSTFYVGTIEGVNQKMNIDLEEALGSPYLKECLIAEAAIQCMHNGAYLDLSDIKKSFTYPRWADIVTERALKHDIK